jgi:PIN domain nuclease of toxin-antitoxin system
MISLSKVARTIIEETESQNIKYISIASIWEIAIKVKFGTNSNLRDQLKDVSIRIVSDGKILAILPIKLSHTLRQSKLEFFHKDPFDRLIIAQSIEEGFEVVDKRS